MPKEEPAFPGTVGHEKRVSTPERIRNNPLVPRQNTLFLKLSLQKYELQFLELFRSLSKSEQQNLFKITKSLALTNQNRDE